MQVFKPARDETCQIQNQQMNSNVCTAICYHVRKGPSCKNSYEEGQRGIYMGKE